MIKKMSKLLFGLMMLCCVSSGAFANNYGYFWISTGGSLYHDYINYADSEIEYLLKAEFGKGVPNVNSIIRVEPKNRMYMDLSIIQDISKEFTLLIKQEKCGDGKGIFTSFMTNYGSKECTVDSVIQNIKNNYMKNESLYFDLKYPIKARILGYVSFGYGMFVLVEQVEVLKK